MEMKHGQQVKQTIIPVCPRELSHEFNNALTSILGNAEFLSQENLTPEQISYIKDIKASGEHLLGFIRELLKNVKSESINQNAEGLKKHEEEISVLVVEDEPFIQKVHSKMLTDLGCHVEIASDGSQALDKLTHENDYQLVFMDINMPKMNGIETVEKFRHQESKKSHMPIVALTAYEDEKIKAECRSAGFDRVVTKPITTQGLKNILTGISKQRMNYQTI